MPNKNDGGEGVAAAHFVMAAGEQERLQGYLQRGRSFQNTASEQLQALFVDLFHKWSVAPTTWADRWQLYDVQAEYQLRGIKPPFDLVKDDLDAIGKAIAEGIEGMEPERLEEIEEGILDDYREAKKSQN